MVRPCRRIFQLLFLVSIIRDASRVGKKFWSFRESRVGFVRRLLERLVAHLVVYSPKSRYRYKIFQPLLIDSLPRRNCLNGHRSQCSNIASFSPKDGTNFPLVYPPAPASYLPTSSSSSILNNEVAPFLSFLPIPPPRGQPFASLPIGSLTFAKLPTCLLPWNFFPRPDVSPYGLLICALPSRPPVPRTFPFSKLQHVERSALYVKFSADITKEFLLGVSPQRCNKAAYLAASIARGNGYAKQCA